MEILNKTEITKGNPLILVFVMAGILFLCFSISHIAKSIKSLLVYAILFVLCFAGAIITDNISDKISTGKYRYDVIIHDDYPVVDFYDRYKVIERRGRIWVIEDIQN